eukprot:CAMPEP_0183331992 /NCGR_PEP_ID=MMETSP0164_2-20130417/1258_1 /TAXON_ID=221442 /ORGANISM="Coccolithus pelagicus ssp braarudi, Strain PLY182g" /LENGTH=50 /DNA_ID=CAMNT_0025500613 /DNA_START=727 /DNA_END=879 /DNA_ORIENTATION=-
MSAPPPTTKGEAGETWNRILEERIWALCLQTKAVQPHAWRGEPAALEILG